MAFEAISRIAGAGSQAAPQGGRRATSSVGRPSDEQAWLRGLVTGEVRQGALDAQVQEAVAAVAEVPLPAVRRAAMLAGSTLAAAVAAFHGGETALAAIGLEVGRPGAAHARLERPRRGRGPGQDARRTGRDRRQARRHPHPGAPRRRRRARGDPQPRRHHRSAARGRGDRPVAARPSASSSTARRWCWPTTVARDRSRRRRHAPRRPAAASSRRTSSTSCTSTAATCSTSPATCAWRVLDGLVPEPAPGRPAGDRRRRGRPGVRRRHARRRARGGGREGPRRAATKPVAAARVGQGQAGPHPRPGGARRGVGQRSPTGLVVQHPPRRPGPGGRLRDAGQDLQGHDRRDARLADRALHRAGRPHRRTAARTSSTSAPSRSWRSPSTASSARPATPAAWRCASRGSCATATTSRPHEADTIEDVRRHLV